jgi:hypothetical protein
MEDAMDFSPVKEAESWRNEKRAFTTTLYTVIPAQAGTHSMQPEAA